MSALQASAICHLRLAGGLDLAAREQVGRVGERPVRLRVEAEVGHRPVEHGDDGGEQRLLHAGRLEGDDRLDRLVRVVGVADLHGVEAEGALEDAEALLAAQRQADAAGELRRVERVDRAVLGQDDLVAGLDAHDAARVGEQVDQPVDLVLLERRDLAALDGVGRAGLEVVAQLLRRELGHVAVAHARADRAHRRTSSLVDLVVMTMPSSRSAPRMIAASSVGDAVRQRVRHVRLEDRARLGEGAVLDRESSRSPPSPPGRDGRSPPAATARACAPSCGRGSGSRRTARSRRSRRCASDSSSTRMPRTHCLIIAGELVVHDELAEVEGHARLDHPQTVDEVGACQRRHQAGQGLLVATLGIDHLGVALRTGDPAGQQVEARDLGDRRADERRTRASRRSPRRGAGPWRWWSCRTRPPLPAG